MKPVPRTATPEPADGVDEFRADVLAGLARRPRRIPCKYFYDALGARIFERICELPEYYPTRTETAMLRAHAAEIARLIGPGASLIEFGSGSAAKARILLDALAEPAAYVPVDLSREQLLASAAALARDYPRVRVAPLCADYARPFELLPGTSAPRVGFFPGSTIGNFPHAEAVVFLRGVAACLGPGSGLLVGADLKKDARVLHAAYNDAGGVTAEFNLNLLRRANRELGADFDLDRFAHDARWLAQAGRIEMHLVARCDQTVRIGAARFDFRAGESIHTEDSHKYDVDEFRGLAESAGWRAVRHWIDPARLFSVHFLRAP